ncbi:hypothetical protein [Nesterenkonia sp. K-15-9-6]|uniref:hypothetical protein n=1 Tax=Nesterenkonia sp. K-15-9-6 TaxID=3093918 RepID=UPI00404516C6
MPTISLAVMENRVREARPDLERGTVRRVAKLAKRRWEAFTYIPSHEEALQLIEALVYADPTGNRAVHHS